MDLKSLLQPDGDRLRIFGFALAYSLVGASGSLVVCLKYRDYIWAMDVAFFSVACALFVIASAWALWAAFGKRLPTATGLVLAVVIGCLVSQVLELWIIEQLLGFEIMAGHKSYAYRLSL